MKVNTHFNSKNVSKMCFTSQGIPKHCSFQASDTNSSFKPCLKGLLLS